MSKFLNIAAVAVLSGMFAASVFADETPAPASDQPAATAEKSTDAAAPAVKHGKKHHNQKNAKKPVDQAKATTDSTATADQGQAANAGQTNPATPAQ